jgi:hypothetical protein
MQPTEMNVERGHEPVSPAADGRQDDQRQQHAPDDKKLAEHAHGMTSMDGKAVEDRHDRAFPHL